MKQEQYIDELPVWSDGTALKSTPMTGMQWRIWALAASGKFFEGFVVFMGGVTVPLINREFHLAAAEQGLVTSASLAGILVGTILLGGLSDYFGRKRMFIAEMTNWLIVRGAHDKAEQAVTRLLYRKPTYPRSVALTRHVADEHRASSQSFVALFKGHNLRATIFSSAPWFLQDLGTYGIGVFTPTMIAAALGSGPDKIRSPADVIASGSHSAQAARSQRSRPSANSGFSATPAT